MLWLGIGSLLIALLCFLGYRSTKNKQAEILTVQTSRIQDIKERAEAVSETLGQGYCSDYTEIKGQLEANEVITAPLSGEDCVYYRSSISREWEELERYTDSEGQAQERSNQVSEIIYSSSSSTSFFINDGSGKLRVNPERAEIELETVLAEQKTETQVQILNHTLRTQEGLTLDVSPDTQRWEEADNYSHLYYRFSESVLKPNGLLYTLGTVVDTDGVLTLVKPTEKGQRYIISRKSEEELVAQQESQQKGLRLAAIIFALIGLICIAVKLLV